MTTAEILRAAADLIEPAGAWTQGCYARGKSGREVDQFGRFATSWCALGAMQRVAPPEKAFRSYQDANQFIRNLLGGRAVGSWNDAPKRTQAEVVAKLREAADLAERGEA